MRSFLDRYCDRMGNVVLRDSNGNPSIFVKHAKINSSDLDSRLPNHVHPAFVTGGTTYNSILIGKYPSSVLTDDGSILYSLPNMPPKCQLTHETALAGAKLFGGTATEITIADHGLLVLTAHSLNSYPRGNNANGGDYRDYTLWTTGSKAVGYVCQWNGYTYTCIKATDGTGSPASNTIPPDQAPAYWRRGERAGGTPDKTQQNSGGICRSTLTGSGPLSWYLNNDISMESDLNGLCEEVVTGVRIYDGEIQILGDKNDAASPNADLSASSSAWRAIVPGDSSDSYELVPHGTAGTVKYKWDGTIKLTAGESTLTAGDKSCEFRNIGVDSTIAAVPSILYELGLAPLPGCTLRDFFQVTFNFGSGTGQFHELTAMACGGCTAYGYAAGIARLSFSMQRTVTSANVGSRVRAIA